MWAFITSHVVLVSPFTALGLSFLFCKMGVTPTAMGHWAQLLSSSIWAFACSPNSLLLSQMLRRHCGGHWGHHGEQAPWGSESSKVIF